MKYIIFLLFFFSSCAAYAKVYYISNNGSDENLGSFSKPWKTIGKANITIQAGDTVFIREGTYHETIRPSKSGTSTNYITYSSYKNEEVVISNLAISIDLSNDFIKIHGLKFRRIRHDWAIISGSHNIIINCNFEDTDNTFTGWSGIYLTNGSSYNKIIKNYIKGSSVGPHDLIYLRPSSYNLIMGNTVIGGLHIGISITGKSGPTHHNVVKNNRIVNKWHTGISIWKKADYSIVEGNIIVDSGENHATNYKGSNRDRILARSRHNGIQVGASNCIIRDNYLFNNGIAISINSFNIDFPANDNRIYGNIFYKNYTGFSVGSPGPVNLNVVRNNIFKTQTLNHIRRSPGNVPYVLKVINNRFSEGNIYFSPVGEASLKELESKLPALWKNNRIIDNLRENINTLNSSLTTTISSGSGTSLMVLDAKYFTNGYGITEGDLIQLVGQTNSARITKVIDNTLMLDKPLSWNKAQGVNLIFNSIVSLKQGYFEAD